MLKIERPEAGDETRAWGPPFAGGESAYFLSLNRGKDSLALDLTSPDDLGTARRLAGRAHVLVENFRVGWMAGRGLDPAALWRDNPGLVYCSISACGQDGPDAGIAGYDFLIQGRCGLMSITGEPEGVPMKVGVAVIDQLTGLYAAIGILAGLRSAEASGRGCLVDASLLDCGVAALANVGANHLVGGTEPHRLGNMHPNIVPYALFHASDGPLILTAGNDRQWRALCGALDCPQLASDPRFAANPDRVAHREEVSRILAERLAGRPRREWLAAFSEAGVPAGPVQTVAEAVRDPQVGARGMVQTLSHPAAGPVRLVRNPLLPGGEPAAAPPRLNERGPETAARWLA